MSGGAREGAGRKPAPENLKKVPYNTKLPRWLREWLTGPAREKSGPVLIEEALRKVHKLRPPAGDCLGNMQVRANKNTKAS